MNIDICNGDADGLCAVVQWRLYLPQTAQLITGLKRDIALLERVHANYQDQLLVCDVSLQRNWAPLMRLLALGVSVRYFDHHQVDNIPVHPRLETHIEMASDTCTSLLMNRYLQGRFQAWALVGAYGDNLAGVADKIAVNSGLSSEMRQRLQALGEAVNYNAYGDSTQDIYIPPADLYTHLIRYPNPLDFLAHESLGQALINLRKADLQRAKALIPYAQDTQTVVYLLPDVPWSRRVSGSFANLLASTQPWQAHAVLKPTAVGDFEVSVRAPQSAPVGAAEFCRGFGGDGRAGAAGIDHLPVVQLDAFIAAFSAAPWRALPPVCDPF